MDEFNSDGHYVYYCGQESLRRNGVAIMVNKRIRNAVLGCSLENDRMISVHFQGKPFNITVIQAYTPTNNAEEAEVGQLYEDLARPFRTNTHKRCPFHYRGLQCKIGSQETPGVTGKFGLGVRNEAVQFSRSVVSNSLQPHESQHARPPCPSPSPRVHSDSSPLSQ